MGSSELAQFLNVLIGGTLVAVLTAIIAGIRKIKSGNIADDDAIIARLDADNVKLRSQNDQLTSALEKERQARWRAEDNAAAWRRQLVDHSITPTIQQDRELTND